MHQSTHQGCRRSCYSALKGATVITSTSVTPGLSSITNPARGEQASDSRHPCCQVRVHVVCKPGCNRAMDNEGWHGREHRTRCVPGRGRKETCPLMLFAVCKCGVRPLEHARNRRVTAGEKRLIDLMINLVRFSPSDQEGEAALHSRSPLLLRVG